MQIDIQDKWYGPAISIKNNESLRPIVFSPFLSQKDFKKISPFSVLDFCKDQSEIPKLSRKSTGKPFPDFVNYQLYLNSKVCELYSKSFMGTKEKVFRKLSPQEHFINFQAYMFAKTTLIQAPHFLREGPRFLVEVDTEFYQFRHRIQIGMIYFDRATDTLSIIERAEAKNGNFLKSIKYNLTESMVSAIIGIEGLSPEMPRSQMIASSIAHMFGRHNTFDRFFNMSPKQFLKEREKISKSMSKKIDLRKSKDIYTMVMASK
jgi:hypothetical protein